jgi:hypothetical protein
MGWPELYGHPVHSDAIRGGIGARAQRIDHHTVHCHPALDDQCLGCPARGYTGAGKDLL